MVEMPRPEQFDGLIDKVAMQFQHVVADHQFLRAVGDGVQHYALTQIVLAEKFACKNRRIDQHFVIYRVIGDGIARRRFRAQRSRRLPAPGVSYAGAHRNAPDEIARRIQRHRFPLDVGHLVGHLDAALIACRRRQELERDVQIAGAGGHVDMEGIDVDRIARPGQRLDARLDDQIGQLFHLPAGPVIAGQPLREQQHHRPRLRHRNRLLDAENRPVEVGRIDLQGHRAGEGDVARGGDRVDDRHGLRRAVGGKCRDGRGDQEQGSGAEEHGLVAFGKCVVAQLCNARAPPV